MEFTSHQSQRFFERYGKIIDWSDIDKMNVIVMNSPQLPYTPIHFFEYNGIEIFCYVKNNKIATFLTRQQAYNTHFTQKNLKQQTITTNSSKFNISNSFDGIVLDN
jgi:hypothetical protein